MWTNRPRVGFLLAAVTILVAGSTAVAVVLWKSHPARDLIAAANALDFRVIDGRLSEPIEHRPVRRADLASVQLVRQTAIDLQKRWKASRSPDDGRLAAAACLAAGHHDVALDILGDVLRRGTSDDLKVVVQKSEDAASLTDFSAAALERTEDRQSLLLAYEAADRAWRLARTPSAGWNRALAAERIGIHAFAARAWREVAALETSPSWKAEAVERERAAAQRAAAPPDRSLELFFYRELFQRAIEGAPLADVAAGDSMASDAAAALARLDARERQRAVMAMQLYLIGRNSFEMNEWDDARESYSIAEGELDALHVPLVLIARDQRIRAECSLGKAGCLESMRAYRREITTNTRYAWLSARSAYGEGQALYRQGRVYEAVEHLQFAMTNFDRLGDRASAGFMYSLIANQYAAAGETELAIDYYHTALAYRTPPIGDRRRKIIEDVMMFLLRHGYLAATELLLDELVTLPASDAANVQEAMLRGIIAFRRGDPRNASAHFARAHVLLRAVKDDAARADVQLRVAIAEAGSRMQAANPIIAELDAAIAAHEHTEFSVWMPQLLTERGAAFESRGDLARAEADYLRAIEIHESREPRIDETILALNSVSPGESPFDRAIRLLLREGRIVAALSIAQRSNAVRISSLHARGTGVRDVFRQERGSDGIAELQRVLRADEIAVAHHLLRDELITWLVTRDSVRAMRRPVHLNDLRAADVERLSDALLRGWIDQVPRGATLLIQPPAELEAIPFAMLRTRGGELLVQRNPSATAPSFRALARAASDDASRERGRSAYFAAAPLPGGELDALPLSITEVTRASGSYPDAEVDAHATRAHFIERSPSFAIVHFAGHVVVNPARPLSSAFVFENGELLYLHELDPRWFASARLVVLSGCETGRSPRPTMSVANALLIAGVPSVVYTLRPVPDDVAESFAVAFHRAVAAGKTRAEAVREAQLALMRQWPDDSVWSAFALAGAAGPLKEVEKGE